MKTKALTELIRSAWCECPPPDQDNIIEHQCLECHRVRDDFRNKRPEDIPSEVLEYHSDSLPFFSANAKRYYYPAYLLHAISDVERRGDSNVTMFLLFDLGSDHRHDPDGGFTQNQIEAVLSFLNFVTEHDDLDDWSDEVELATSKWRALLQQSPAGNT